jgi:hypothetical protein
MPTPSGLPTSNNWGWTETLNYTCRTWSLTQNELSSISIIRVTTTLKIKKMSDNTLKKCEWQHTQERWALKFKTVYKNSRSRRIKLEEWRETRLSLNKNFASIVFLSLELISLTLYMTSKFSGKNNLARWIKIIISERIALLK